MPRWCPDCRSEWWNEPPTCPDCDVPLVDDRPPEPTAPEHTGALSLGDQIDIDLTGAGRSRRWRIELELRNASLPFRWERDHLLTVEAAIDVLDALDLIDFSGPDEDPPEEDGAAVPFATPSLQAVATRTWWTFANPVGPVRVLWGVVVIIALVTWALHHVFS